MLASSHNDQVGAAWPGIAELAQHNGITERYCRTLLASLESIGVIERIWTRNLHHGGQSSNAYIFPGLGDSRAKLFENLNKIALVPRAPLAMRRGSGHPIPADAGIRAGQTGMAVTPGDAVPPIEHLRESLGENSKEILGECANDRLRMSPATLVHHEPNKRTTPVMPEKHEPAKRALETCCDMGLGQTAWNAAVEDLRKTVFSSFTQVGHGGFVPGAKDWKSYRFEKATVVRVQANGSGSLIMSVRSPNPKSTARGLKSHAKHLECYLSRFYGCSVNLKLDTGR